MGSERHEEVSVGPRTDARLRASDASNGRDKSTILVRFAAIILEPLRADRAEIVCTERPMAVHPDYECDGCSRQPKEQSHQARFRGPGHSPLHMANGIRLMPTPLALSPIHPYQIAYVGGRDRAHVNRGSAAFRRLR